MADSNVVIHIVNSALYLLGEPPITSLDQGTPTTKLCRELYPGARDTLLSWQAWPFATVRQSLARLAAVPPSDYSYYYALPTIPVLVRVIDIDLINRRVDFQREVYVNPEVPTDQQAVLATDATSVTLRYVGLTSEGVWSPLFVETLGVWLAARMAASVSGKASLRATFLTELGFDAAGRVVGGMLGKLQDMAGYEDSPREIPMPDAYLVGRDGWGDSAPTHMRW